MSKHTLEQVLEALINKEDDRANELLHQFFVAKGKQIYEELSSFDDIVEESEDEELDEAIGGSQAEDFEDEIVATEEDLENEKLFSEDEEMDDMAAEEPGEEEATMDLAMGDDMEADMGDDMEAGDGAEAGAEEAMAKVEDALAELKAAFAEIMGDEGADDMEVAGDEEVEEEFDALGEATMPKPVAAPAGGDDGVQTKSPVSKGPKVSDQGADAIKIHDGNTAGGKVAAPKQDDAGNVNKVGNAKAPAPKAVSKPAGGDNGVQKTSPVAKG
jgi:hypothetical protein